MTKPKIGRSAKACIAVASAVAGIATVSVVEMPVISAVIGASVIAAVAYGLGELAVRAWINAVVR